MDKIDLQNRQQKLLAINFGGIGDEILFLPVLSTIKQRRPNWHVTLLLEPRSKSIEQVTDLIDRTIAFDIKKRPLLPADLVSLVALLRAGGFDMVVSSGSSPLVSCLLFLSGIPRRIGYDTGTLSRLLLTCAVPLNRSQYAACMYYDLARGFGTAQGAQSVKDFAAPSASPWRPVLVVRQQSRINMQKFLEHYGIKPDAREQRKILIHPGTSKLALQKGIIKTWKAGSWAQLMSKLRADANTRVILAGGPDDSETIREIIERTAPNACVSAYGQTRNLADLAALIDLCDLLVCVDSAPMHIAVGLNKPLVALFGPTNPDRLLPEDAKFKALRSAKSTLTTGRTEVRISLDEVVQAVHEQIS